MNIIEFRAKNGIRLKNKKQIAQQIRQIAITENKIIGELLYVFCDDEFLLEINNTYLGHNTYTDVIAFDYTSGNIISGEVFISTERVTENAKTAKETLEDETLRVIFHATLHLCGYKDKNPKDKETMRNKENEHIKTFHVEHKKETTKTFHVEHQTPSRDV